jgi:two-component system sensor histidine kinase ChiS
MTPRENFDFVNAYLGRVSPVIQRHGGFIDKYIGDGIMALFSSRPAAAVLSAIGMHEAVRSFNLQRIAEGESPIEIGIGIHCGSLMLGTVGDEARMDTTVISDVVNSASRLEGLNKLYGTRIIVSEDVRKEIQPEDGVELRCLDLVRVKGRTGAVRIYEVLNVWEADRRRLLAETGALFESAGEMYRSGKIGESMAILHRVLELDGRDAAAELYIKRCAEILEKGLPPGWDGVTVLFRK